MTCRAASGRGWAWLISNLAWTKTRNLESPLDPVRLYTPCPAQPAAKPGTWNLGSAEPVREQIGRVLKYSGIRILRAPYVS